MQNTRFRDRLIMNTKNVRLSVNAAIISTQNCSEIGQLSSHKYRISSSLIQTARIKTTGTIYRPAPGEPTSCLANWHAQSMLGNRRHLISGADDFWYGSDKYRVSLSGQVSSWMVTEVLLQSVDERTLNFLQTTQTLMSMCHSHATELSRRPTWPSFSSSEMCVAVSLALVKLKYTISPKYTVSPVLATYTVNFALAEYTVKPALII